MSGTVLYAERDGEKIIFGFGVEINRGRSILGRKKVAAEDRRCT